MVDYRKIKLENDLDAIPTVEESIFSTLSESDKRKNEKMVQIALAIKHERMARSMTQKDFAKFLHIKQAQVSKWESGDCNFTMSTLYFICDKLGLDLNIDIRPRDKGKIMPIVKKWRAPITVKNSLIAEGA